MHTGCQRKVLTWIIDEVTIRVNAVVSCCNINVVGVVIVIRMF